MKVDSKKHMLLIRDKIKGSFILQLLVCVMLCGIILLGFFVVNKRINRRNFRKINIEDNIELINSIEELVFNNDVITLRGYAFLLNDHSHDNTIYVILNNLDEKEEIWLDVKQVNRTDVNTYFDCEYDYSNSGFVAHTDTMQLNNDNTYEIIICIDYFNGTENERIAVSTNKFLLNYEIFDYIPNEFKTPKMLESNLLKNVISGGTLCFYNKEVGMYVYQHGGKLYWIATEDFKFDENGKTYIPYQIFTSQMENLPEHRIQFGYDMQSFYFENNEYNDESVEPYRVAVRDIPTEYSISYIRTGVYNLDDSKWLWIESFQLDNLMGNTLN